MVISLRRFYRPAIIVLALLVLCAVTAGILRCILGNISGTEEMELDERTEEAFLTAISCFAQSGSEVEIFDIAKGEVIKRFEVTSEIQRKVEEYLDKITGLYVKVKAFPDKGYIMKVPLKPQTEVSNEWLNSYGIYSVNDVYIIFPDGEKPYLLILDSSLRPLFFNFEQADKVKLHI